MDSLKEGSDQSKKKNEHCLKWCVIATLHQEEITKNPQPHIKTKVIGKSVQ